jgi:hypothetical protein
MIYQDDRTPEEKKTHDWIVLMTDSFLSGWGRAKNGLSYAGWATTYENLDKVETWVRSRSDARRVRIVKGYYRPKANSACAHCHIYVVGPGHSSLGGN